MTLVKSLLLACALALPVTMTQAIVHDAPAQAAAKKAKKAKAAKKTTKVKTAAAKSCGEFKYLKGGKCQDARSKKGGEG